MPTALRIPLINFRTKCDIESRQKICKVPQHIRRDVITVPEKELENDDSNDTETEIDNKESVASSVAPETKDSATIEMVETGTTTSEKEATEAEIDEAKASRLSASRVVGNQDFGTSKTETPLKSTMRARSTKWVWQLVLRTCNLQYILPISFSIRKLSMNYDIDCFISNSFFFVVG